MWKTVVNSGASSDVFKVSSVPVADIELNTGASREDITLGSPSGSVPINVNGGAGTANLHRPQRGAASGTPSGRAPHAALARTASHAIGTRTAQTTHYDSASARY